MTLKRPRRASAEANVDLRARSRAAARSSAKPPRRKCASCSNSPSSWKDCRATSACTRGGVLIAPGKLTDFCPLYVQPGAERDPCRSSTRTTSKPSGSVKFDFLGLTTLTILDWTLALHPQARSRSDRRARDAAARRPAALRHLQERQYDGGVPVRIARHARPAEAGAADALRGHHRAGRALPARADGARFPITSRASRAASASPIPTRGSSRSSSRRTA